MRLFGRHPKVVSDITQRQVKFDNLQTLGELRAAVRELDGIGAPDSAQLREPLIDYMTLYVVWDA